MRLDMKTLPEFIPSQIEVGNLYRADIAFAGGVSCWVVVALDAHHASCVGFNKDGKAQTVTNFSLQQLARRELLGKCDLSDLVVGIGREPNKDFTLFGHYDERDGLFSRPGFYSNEDKLVVEGTIIPLYRRNK